MFTRLMDLLTARNTNGGNEKLDWSIEKLKLPTRAMNCLINDGKTTVRDILECTESELLRMPFFGRKFLTKLKEALRPIGYEIGQLKVRD